MCACHFIAEVEVQFNPAVHTVDESDGMVDIPIECGSCADSYTVSITCSDGTAECTFGE